MRIRIELIKRLNQKHRFIQGVQGKRWTFPFHLSYLFGKINLRRLHIIFQIKKFLNQEKKLLNLSVSFFPLIAGSHVAIVQHLHGRLN